METIQAILKAQASEEDKGRPKHGWFSLNYTRVKSNGYRVLYMPFLVIGGEERQPLLWAASDLLINVSVSKRES